MLSGIRMLQTHLQDAYGHAHHRKRPALADGCIACKRRRASTDAAQLPRRSPGWKTLSLRIVLNLPIGPIPPMRKRPPPSAGEGAFWKSTASSKLRPAIRWPMRAVSGRSGWPGCEASRHDRTGGRPARTGLCSMRPARRGWTRSRWRSWSWPPTHWPSASNGDYVGQFQLQPKRRTRSFTHLPFICLPVEAQLVVCSSRMNPSSFADVCYSGLTA